MRIKRYCIVIDAIPFFLLKKIGLPNKNSTFNEKRCFYSAICLIFAYMIKKQ